ncbi:hypothetical protein M0813_22141 [Anaeramoeba flamelloides]|uniref:Uncharacterized protein n=1 Tax=Anaeramoeba flamelloides TaxID=1746091 RepID=A0ABQ8YGJ6_9EUKA|nr:hypothetical protein M0813_22141 [Anaeramoeba flamelloides]
MSTQFYVIAHFGKTQTKVLIENEEEEIQHLIFAIQSLNTRTQKKVTSLQDKFGKTFKNSDKITSVLRSGESVYCLSSGILVTLSENEREEISFGEEALSFEISSDSTEQTNEKFDLISELLLDNEGKKEKQKKKEGLMSEHGSDYNLSKPISGTEVIQENESSDLDELPEIPPRLDNFEKQSKKKKAREKKKEKGREKKKEKEKEQEQEKESNFQSLGQSTDSELDLESGDFNEETNQIEQQQRQKKKLITNKKENSNFTSLCYSFSSDLVSVKTDSEEVMTSDKSEEKEEDEFLDSLLEGNSEESEGNFQKSYPINNNQKEEEDFLNDLLNENREESGLIFTGKAKSDKSEEKEEEDFLNDLLNENSDENEGNIAKSSEIDTSIINNIKNIEDEILNGILNEKSEESEEYNTLKKVGKRKKKHKKTKPKLNPKKENKSKLKRIKKVGKKAIGLYNSNQQIGYHDSNKQELNKREFRISIATKDHKWKTNSKIIINQKSINLIIQNQKKNSYMLREVNLIRNKSRKRIIKMKFSNKSAFIKFSNSEHCNKFQEMFNKNKQLNFKKNMSRSKSSPSKSKQDWSNINKSAINIFNIQLVDSKGNFIKKSKIKTDNTKIQILDKNRKKLKANLNQVLFYPKEKPMILMIKKNKIRIAFQKNNELKKFMKIWKISFFTKQPSDLPPLKTSPRSYTSHKIEEYLPSPDSKVENGNISTRSKSARDLNPPKKTQRKRRLKRMKNKNNVKQSLTESNHHKNINRNGGGRNSHHNNPKRKTRGNLRFKFKVSIMPKETKILEEGGIQIMNNKIRITFLNNKTIKSELSKIKHLKHKKQLDSSRITINSNEIYVIFESSQDRKKFSKLYQDGVLDANNKNELKSKDKHKEETQSACEKKMNYIKLNKYDSSQSNNPEKFHEKRKLKIQVSLVDKYRNYLCNGKIIIKENKIHIQRGREKTIISPIDKTFIQTTPGLNQFIVIYMKETLGKLYINLESTNDLLALKKHITVSDKQVNAYYISKILYSDFKHFPKKSYLRIDIEKNALLLSAFSLNSKAQKNFTISEKTKCIMNQKKNSIIQFSISKNKILILDFHSKLVAQNISNLINETKKKI